MNSRERLLTALDGGQPDRLPVTTHHLMPYFLEQAFALPRPVAPSFNFWWPWVRNYTGEIYLGFGVGSANYWPTYIWLDTDLKEQMGY